jgi:SAM-dependent methyltransferase
MFKSSNPVTDPAAGGSETTIVTPDGRSLSLEYFSDWGGPSVVGLTKSAIEIVGSGLTGLRVLEVGYGHGRMSCLFALLGAQVFAVDTHEVARPDALAEAKRWGVSERIQFSVYSGDAGDIREEPFDVVFTKSVLLLIPELERFLRGLSTKLRPGGQVAFVENGFHGPLSILGRRLIHWWRNNQDDYYPGVPMYNWHLPVYLSAARINTINKVFDVRHVVRAESPHWYLIHGFKRPANAAQS